MIMASHASYVLDASVVAKWFTCHEESDREKAIRLRDLHCRGECRLIFPEYGLLEVLNAIRYSPRADEGDTAEALTVLMDLGLQLEYMEEALLRKSIAIAWAYGITLYDASYIALAERVGYPFVTADGVLMNKMKGHSIVLELGSLEFRVD